MKYLLVILVCVFILLIPASIFFAKFDNQTFIGKALKRQLLRYPAAVQLINLDEPGDLRFSYLHTKSPLKVIVNYSQESSPDNQAANWIGDMIQTTTKRTADVTITSQPIAVSKDAYSIADLNQIRTLIRKPNDSALHIVYLPVYEEKPSYAGIALHRDTFFIFKTAINNLSPKPQERLDLEKSTLMHEWAHLLGLGHSDFQNCLMSSSVEIEQGTFKQNTILTEYCWDELYQITHMR